MSDVQLAFDHLSKKIDLKVNGEEIEQVSAVNIAVSERGSICTVVFQPGAVDCTALLQRLVIGEEAPTEHGGN